MLLVGDGGVSGAQWLPTRCDEGLSMSENRFDLQEKLDNLRDALDQSVRSISWEGRRIEHDLAFGEKRESNLIRRRRRQQGLKTFNRLYLQAMR